MFEPSHAEQICPTPPRDALAMALNTVARLHMMSGAASGSLPHSNSSQTFTNLLSSMHNTTNGTLSPIPEKALAGVNAMLEGLHKRLRMRHVRGLYDSYHEQVLEQAAAIASERKPNTMKRFHTSLSDLMIALGNDALVPSLREYRDLVEECAREDRPFTLRDKLEIMLRGATFYKELADAREKCSLSTHDGYDVIHDFRNNSAADFGGIIDEVWDEVKKISPLRLTLRDQLGNVITTVELPEVPHLNAAAGIILGASSHAGFADTQKFPAKYAQFVRNTIGEAVSLHKNLLPLADQVHAALKQKDYTESQADAILSQTSFNLSPKIWQEMRELVARHLQEMAFYVYLSSTNATLEYKDCEELLQSLDPIVKAFGMQMPDPREMVPTTRMHYHALMGAIDHQLSSGAFAAVHGGSLEHLQNDIKALKENSLAFKESLLGVSGKVLDDETKPCVHISKESDAQKPLDPLQKGQLKEYLATVEHIYARRANPNKSIPMLELFMKTMQRGLEPEATRGAARSA